MRYWSTTHKQWQTLIVDAYALTGLQSSQRREDFTPDEMKEGAVLYFEQADNLSGKAIYRMHIAEASADRLVFDVENVSTMRYLLMPSPSPGRDAVDLLSGSRIGKRLALLQHRAHRNEREPADRGK